MMKAKKQNCMKALFPSSLLKKREKKIARKITLQSSMKIPQVFIKKIFLVARVKREEKRKGKIVGVRNFNIIFSDAMNLR